MSVVGILEDYLTRDQFAAEIGKSTRTLDRWYELRIGPPRTMVGMSVMYRREAVMKWLREQEQKPVRKRRSA